MSGYLRDQQRDLALRLAGLEHQLRAATREPEPNTRNDQADARARADALHQAALGRPAPDPVPGESADQYRARLATNLKQFSPTFAKTPISHLTAGPLEAVERTIYADAAAAAKAGTVTQPGELRAIRTTELGHDVTKYVGDQRVTWAPFAAGAGCTVTLNRAIGRR